MNIKNMINKILEEAGLFKAALETHIPVIENVGNGIIQALDNPIIDGVLSKIIPQSVLDQVPHAESLFLTAMQKVTIGTEMEKDIEAATTNEDKVKAFLTDLQKYGIDAQNMYVQKITGLLLGGLDNNQLKQNLYDLFAQAHFSLKAAGK